jgi:hypothetical protein
MIYVSQLYDGRYHVQTTTDAPHREVYAVRALPQDAFEDAADARQAQRFAADWADRNRWKIMATDRATGEEFQCFTWRGCPTAGIARARADSRAFERDCHTFRALPAA